MLSFIFAGLLGLAAAQAPNTLAKYHPTLRTASQNATWVIVAADKADVQKAVGSTKLLPVPVNDQTLFPQGFDADKHPVLVATGYQADIQVTPISLLPLQIDSLSSAVILVPFTDCTGDGVSACNYPIKTVLGGKPLLDLINAAPLVPSLVASLTGTPSVPGIFDPEDAAYKTFQNDIHINSAKQSGVFNGISGPSLQGDALTVFSSPEETQIITAHAIHAFINQPLTLVALGFPVGSCIRNNYYFNDTTFLTPTLRTANVSIGAAPIIKDGLASKEYSLQGAYNAVAQIVGHNAQSCKEAIAENDPFASQ